MKTRILLVDDHELMREGLRLLLQNQPDLEVVGGAGNGATALAQATELMPDLIVMDLQLGDLDGIETSRQVLAVLPETRIIVVSGLIDSQMVNQGVEAGIKGFLLKTNAAAELIRAIGAVMNGLSYTCPHVSQTVVSSYREILTRNAAPEKSSLASRDRDLLKLTAEGLRMKDIANRLNIGVKTVETHRSHLMKKLVCGSSAELTRYAIREGISPV